jgi:Ca-activated chloride channel family protein
VIVALPLGKRALTLALAGLAAGAAAPARLPAPVGQFASGVNLVEVYVTVNDPHGAVSGLTQADFLVEEDGAPQTIGAFAAGDFPLSVALALDRSFSVSRERLRAAASSASTFVRALRAADRVMVVAIGSETEVLARLSSDHRPALSSLAHLDSWGTTPLYDATLAAIDAIQDAPGRRALILISDGVDRYSGTTASALLEAARRRDVLVYPIVMSRERAPVLSELAEVTGARSFLARDARALDAALSELGRELRVQYMLGYTPARRPDSEPRWRSIHVSVNRPDVTVRARHGYFGR